MRALVTLALCAALCLAGCASNTSLYSWGNYEKSLYKYYKKPDTSEKHLVALESAIASGEKNNNVAPGMYAETGFLFLSKGDAVKAITYFSKEKETWPESSYLMDRMIQSASRVPGNDQGGAVGAK